MIKINEKEIDIGQFPNKEVNIKRCEIRWAMRPHCDLKKPARVEFRYENDSDLLHLMFVKAEMDKIYPAIPKTLYIRYMPYSRMDRENDVYTFTLKCVTEFINSLNFDTVVVEEPHSDVCLALLDNCTAVYPTIIRLHKVIRSKKIGFDRKKDYLFFPDAGAQKRYAKLESFKTLVGYKERDMETGRITKYNVFGNITKGSKVMILDDLCSKGGTFMLAAQELKDLGAGDIYLFVGHVERTIFNGSILNTDLIKLVITSDSMERTKHSKIWTIEGAYK